MYQHTLVIALLLGTSAAQAATVVAVDTPQNTVKRINANYNSLRSDCKEPSGAPRGYYYCSGVSVRMVDDGPFNPWDYSPYAMKTGATSFSWIRADLSTNRLIRPAGFILRTPEDARQLKAPVMETGFMCIYSFDGFTGPERLAHGCGAYNAALPANHQARSATSPENLNNTLAYGSCDSAGIDTADQWRKNYRYVRNGLNRIQVTQCSWNVEQPSDWAAMIDVHQNPRTVTRNLQGREVPAADGFARKELTNEMLLRNAGQTSDGSARLPFIDAFVWDPNSTYVANTRGDTSKAKPTVGLKPAQAFQRKLYAQGYAVPVLRIDFSKPASERFSYVAADQVVPLGDQPLPSDGDAQDQDYIDSATWVKRHDPGMGREEWTLNVVLKQGVKVSAGNLQDIYQALENSYGDGQHWRENEIYPGSMHAQVECLASHYPNKTQWNLEPFRPTASANDMRKSGCNPVRKLIEAAAWSEQTDNKTGAKFFGLQVVPTLGGRQASVEDLYAELFRQRGRDEQWQEGVAGSMKLQLACLHKNYNPKKDWNLEPYRQATSSGQTEAAQCNP